MGRQRAYLRTPYDRSHSGKSSMWRSALHSILDIAGSNRSMQIIILVPLHVGLAVLDHRRFVVVPMHPAADIPSHKVRCEPFVRSYPARQIAVAKPLSAMIVLVRRLIVHTVNTSADTSPRDQCAILSLYVARGVQFNKRIPRSMLVESPIHFSQKTIDTT